MENNDVKQAEFYSEELSVALDNCNKQGYNAVFMSKISELRSWDDWYSTLSIKATGRSKAGNAVVVYSHKHNYFSNPVNIQNIVKDKMLINGAGIIPQEEFQKLIDKEDGKDVFVVDYNLIKNIKFGSVKLNISGVLDIPQVVYFLGGEKKAEEYLTKFSKVRNTHPYVKEYNDPEVYFYDSSDLFNVPVSRPLFVGYECFRNDVLFCGNLYGEGRFIGVKQKVRNASDINNSKSNHLEDRL